MTDGLIWSFAGRVGICVGFAVLGFLISLALTVVVFIRKAPNWHTQTNHQTGMVEEGLARWMLRFLAFFVGGPLLALIIVTGVEVTHWVRDNVPVEALPVGGFVGGLLAVGVIAAKRHLRDRRPVADPVVEPVAMPVPMPQPGHFLPDNMDEWPRAR